MKKNIIARLLVTSVTLLSLIGCGSDITQTGPTVEKETEVIDYLSYNQEDYQKIFDEELGNDIAMKRGGKRVLPITLRDLADGYEELNDEDKIPDFANLTEQELQKVEAELGMTRTEMVNDQEKVMEHFKAKVIYKMFKKSIKILKDKKKKKKNSIATKSAYGEYDDLCDDEFWLLVKFPWNFLGAYQAFEDANAWEKEMFGTPKNMGNTKGDAFRHSIWSVLMAQYNKDEYTHRQDARDWSRRFGTAHESCGGTTPQSKTMDLHNNWIGYNFWYLTSSNRGKLNWWGWDSRWIESLSTASYKQNMFAIANTAKFYNALNDVHAYTIMQVETHLYSATNQFIPVYIAN